MIEVLQTSVRKTAPPAVAAAEAAKTRLAAELGDASGAFYVPRITRFDEPAGVIEFERLAGLKSLVELATDGRSETGDLFRRTGRALAVIHERLVLPEALKIPLPAEWMDREPPVFLHGDFTVANVCLQEPTGRLVILDWSTAPLLGRMATFGPAYFDLSWLTSSLSSYVAYAAAPWRKTVPCDEMADAFLEAYLAARTRELDRAWFDECRHMAWRVYWNGHREPIKTRPWYAQPVWWLREWRAYRRIMAYEPLGTGR